MVILTPKLFTASLANQHGSTKAIEATISFIQPKFYVHLDQFFKDQYINQYFLVFNCSSAEIFDRIVLGKSRRQNDRVANNVKDSSHNFAVEHQVSKKRTKNFVSIANNHHQL